VVPTALVVEGFALDDYPLVVEFRKDVYSEYDTKNKLCDAYKSSEDFRQNCGHLFHDLPDDEEHEHGGNGQTGRRAATAGGGQGAEEHCLPEADGIICCTVVERISWADRNRPHPKARINGNRIEFQDFGYIYVGEMCVAKNRKQLTMMRIQLGSPQGGELALDDGSSNGHSWPP
jgi:hypothetical protein